MKKLVFVSLAAIMASFAASADTVVTSKTYVDTKMQSKMATGSANEIPVYTGSLSDTNAPTFSPRAIHSATTYTVGTDDNKIPTMGAVMAQINSSTSTILPTGTSNQMLQHDGTSWAAVSIDTAPTADHTQPVTSGGVYTALSGKQDTLTFDNTPTENSNNPVKSGGVYTALAAKQDTLTFDNTPTANSDNPVKSGGIKTYADGKVSSATTISTTSTTTAPNEKAVSDAIGAVQTQVTTLANCKHTCADSGCTLINVTCVDAYSGQSPA